MTFRVLEAQARDLSYLRVWMWFSIDFDKSGEIQMQWWPIPALMLVIHLDDYEYHLRLTVNESCLPAPVVSHARAFGSPDHRTRSAFTKVSKNIR